jgi:signal transduction histidine kinase
MSALHAAGWILAFAGLVAVLVLRARQARAVVRIARACHEVRGPLGAARLALAAMDGEAPPARLAALDLELRRAGLALEDLGAARRGRRVAGREEPIAVTELLREQRAVWDLVARALGATLVLGEDLPGVHVLGDRMRLAQAIGNLVVNALQHGGGRVELSARLAGDAVRIEVSDEGPGLPAGIVALAERREGAGRHGHGLAVAASVARRHGGRLAPAPSARGARIGLELPALGMAR